MYLTTRKALLYILVCAFFIACSTQKKIDKAKYTVLTNKQASADVFNELSRIWPCVNDTTFISGGRDTVTTTDTAVVYATSTDTLYKEGEVKERIVTKTRTIHDTLKSVVVDNRALSFQKDSTAKYMNLYLDADKERRELKEEHKDLTKMFGYTVKALLAKWWFWSILVGGGALIFFKGKLGIVGTVISKILNKFK